MTHVKPDLGRLSLPQQATYAALFNLVHEDGITWNELPAIHRRREEMYPGQFGSNSGSTARSLRVLIRLGWVSVHASRYRYSTI